MQKNPPSSLTAAVAVIVASFGLAAKAFAQSTPQGVPEKLGTVDFPVSCNAAAQKHMTRGVSLYHSFHWPEAHKSFSAVAQADPSCAMAHWGLAMVAINNPYIWPLTGKAVQEGAASIEKAKALGAKTTRERDYIAATETFFLDAGKTPARTRQLNFELALEKMTRDYPRDIEAKVLYGMVLAANVDPNDKTYSNQAKAADVLERGQDRNAQKVLADMLAMPAINDTAFAAAFALAAIPARLAVERGRWTEAAHKPMR